jgi:hypothetical protein
LIRLGENGVDQQIAGLLEAPPVDDLEAVADPVVALRIDAEDHHEFLVALDAGDVVHEHWRHFRDARRLAKKRLETLREDSGADREKRRGIRRLEQNVGADVLDALRGLVRLP